MFCARCGQQIPDKSPICPVCGRTTSVEVYLAPAAQPASLAMAAPAAPTVVCPRAHRGVRGWLLFFCIGLTILLPLWTLSLYPLRHVLFNGPAGAAGLVRVVFGIVVGVALWMEKPAAITMLRVYFAMSGALLLWGVLSWVRFLLRYHHISATLLQQILSGFTLSMGLLIAGLLYFSLSERVRATYGSKLF